MSDAQPSLVLTERTNSATKLRTNVACSHSALIIEVVENLFSRRIDQVALDVFLNLGACLRSKLFQDSSVELRWCGQKARIKLAIPEKFGNAVGDLFHTATFILEPDIVLLPVTRIRREVSGAFSVLAFDRRRR